MNFAFVVLHYKAKKDTKECVESILNLKMASSNDHIDVIIVDNGSNDNIEESLKHCLQQENVYFIKSNINLGFSKGNNLGFNFAKYSLNPDFIILSNNDVIIEQPDMLDIIKSKYAKYDFSILGPDIINLNGEHQNPQRENPLSINQINEEIFNSTIKIILINMKIFYLLRRLKKFLNRTITNKNIHSRESIKYTSQDIENVQLHGSFLIFSKNYLDLFDGLFPEPFLYSEEDILFYLSRKYNLKTVYTSDIKILHKEDRSTNELFDQEYSKLKFVYANRIKSLKILKKLMEGKYESHYFIRRVRDKIVSNNKSC